MFMLKALGHSQYVIGTLKLIEINSDVVCSINEKILAFPLL